MLVYYPLRKIRTTQYFANNPAFYRQFGTEGHNGNDMRVRFPDKSGSEYYAKISAVIDGIEYTEEPENGFIFLYAMGDGIVSRAGYVNPNVNANGADPDGYGNYIKVDHGDYETTSAHLHFVFVQTGERVKAGQIIGVTGNTGVSTAPHLHLTIKPIPPNQRNGFLGAVNPTPILRQLALPPVEGEKEAPLVNSGNDEIITDLRTKLEGKMNDLARKDNVIENIKKIAEEELK